MYVLNDDRSAWDHQQPTENDDGLYARDDDEQQVSATGRTNGAQSFMPTPSVSQSPATSSHNGSFFNELSVRSTQQPGGQPPLLHNMNSQPNQGIVDDGLSVNGAAPTINSSGSGMGGVDMMASAQDSSRRSSAFGDYGNGNNGMYAASWPTGTAPSTAQSPYGHQHSHSTSSFVPNVPATHTPQSFVPAGFVETMPRPSYNTDPNQLFRAGDIPPPPLVTQHNFNYSDRRPMPSLPGVSEVIDSVPLGARAGGPL